MLGQRGFVNWPNVGISMLSQRLCVNTGPTSMWQHWFKFSVPLLPMQLGMSLMQILFPTCKALWCSCCPFWLWGVHWMDACLNGLINGMYLDNVMIWKCFLLLSHWLKFLRHVAIRLVIQGPGWPFVTGNHRSPMDSPHKGSGTRALIFFSTFGWTNSRVV